MHLRLRFPFTFFIAFPSDCPFPWTFFLPLDFCPYSFQMGRWLTPTPPGMWVGLGRIIPHPSWLLSLFLISIAVWPFGPSLQLQFPLISFSVLSFVFGNNLLLYLVQIFKEWGIHTHGHVERMEGRSNKGSHRASHREHSRERAAARVCKKNSTGRRGHSEEEGKGDVSPQVRRRDWLRVRRDRQLLLRVF